MPCCYHVAVMLGATSVAVSTLMSVFCASPPAALPTHQTRCFQLFSCAALLVQQAAGHAGPGAAPPPGDHPAQWSAAGTGGVPAGASRHPPAPHRPRLPTGACQVGSWCWLGVCLGRAVGCVADGRQRNAWAALLGPESRWKAWAALLWAGEQNLPSDGRHGQPCRACSSHACRAAVMHTSTLRAGMLPARLSSRWHAPLNLA